MSKTPGQPPESNQSIDEIIDEVRAGDLQAYEHIVRRYEKELWQIAVFALRDSAASEDLVQQAFINAYQNLHRYQSGRDFGAWLRTIARNLLRNELRRSGREESSMRRYHQWLIQHLQGEQSEVLAEKEMMQALTHCRDTLSPPATEALELRYEEGKGFAEIANQLGRSLAATRQLLSRVRIALRECVQNRRVQI